MRPEKAQELDDIYFVFKGNMHIAGFLSDHEKLTAYRDDIVAVYRGEFTREETRKFIK